MALLVVIMATFDETQTLGFIPARLVSLFPGTMMAILLGLCLYWAWPLMPRWRPFWCAVYCALYVLCGVLFMRAAVEWQVKRRGLIGQWEEAAGVADAEGILNHHEGLIIRWGIYWPFAAARMFWECVVWDIFVMAYDWHRAYLIRVIEAAMST
jgi:hypothetical protein